MFLSFIIASSTVGVCYIAGIVEGIVEQQKAGLRAKGVYVLFHEILLSVRSNRSTALISLLTRLVPMWNLRLQGHHAFWRYDPDRSSRAITRRSHLLYTTVRSSPCFLTLSLSRCPQ